jgi:hypothetical protein
MRMIRSEAAHELTCRCANNNEEDRLSMTSTTGSRRLAIAETFLSCLGRSDPQAAIDLLSPTACYHVSGMHSLSGDFHSPVEILRHLESLASLTKGTVDVTKWEDWLIGEHHVAAIGELRMSAESQRYSGLHVFLFAFNEDDSVEHISVFYEDSAAAMRFFRRERQE